MNETSEHRDTDQDPERGYDRLLQDLRSLPKNNAPLDFQYHLTERISALRQVQALPWWKRFFKPASEGGYAVPAFAYGAVATVAVLAVSVYVYRASYVEETFRSEQEAPVEHIAPIQPATETPADQPALQKDLPSPSAPVTAPDVQQSGRQQAPPPPVSVPPSPSAAPAKKSDVREEAEATESYELKFKTRGGFDYDPEFSSPQDSIQRRFDSLRRFQMDTRLPKQPNPR
jgi:hypothetical protein